MSENTPTSEEQIKMLARKVADLELVCAYMIEFFAREDTSNLSRKIAANELRRLAESHTSEELPLAADTAFGEVAEHLRVGTFRDRGFGASGSVGDD